MSANDTAPDDHSIISVSTQRETVAEAGMEFARLFPFFHVLEGVIRDRMVDVAIADKTATHKLDHPRESPARIGPEILVADDHEIREVGAGFQPTKIEGKDLFEPVLRIADEGGQIAVPHAPPIAVMEIGYQYIARIPVQENDPIPVVFFHALADLIRVELQAVFRARMVEPRLDRNVVEHLPQPSAAGSRVGDNGHPPGTQHPLVEPSLHTEAVEQRGAIAVGHLRWLSSNTVCP
jgi:hypothetical protein